MSAIEFWVPGWPKTKGSVVAMPNGFVDHGDAVRDREADIATACEAAMKLYGWRKVRRPVAIAVTYVAFVPAASGDDIYAPPVGAGSRDIDKLPRTVLDALTAARLWDDDSQAVRIVAEKYFADGAVVRPGEYIRAETAVTFGVHRLRAVELSRSARERAAGVGADEPLPAGW